MNMSLQPMVRTLMHSNNLLAPSNKEGPNPTHNSSPKSTEAWRESDRDEPSSKVAPRRRRIPRSLNRSTKRARKPSNSPKMYSRDGKSERGRHLQKSRSPTPSSLPLSYDFEEFDASTKSFAKVRPKCKRKGTY